MSDERFAKVVGQTEDGTLIIEDPAAEGMIAAVEAHNYSIGKHNCKVTFDSQRERVDHFVSRIKERGDDPKDVLITLINADDPKGRPLADALMPDTDWNQFRSNGEIPFARGLAGREGIQEILYDIDEEAAKKLKHIDGIACVVIDSGVAETFSCEV